MENTSNGTGLSPIVLYDEVCNTDMGKSKEYEAQCLDIWDLMFENRIGITHDLTEKLTEM